MSRTRAPALAWRNIWRNRRRTLITLFGMSFGVLLAVIFTGMGDSSYGSLIDHSAKLGSGHVVVQHADYQDLPTLKKTVRGTAELAERAAADSRVDRVVIRIAGAALLASAKKSQGVMFMAIDPTQEDEHSFAIADSISEGEMLTEAGGDGIVLGVKLAQTLGVTLGKKVVYTMTDRSGEIVSGLARVRALVKSGAPTVDGSLCVLPIDTVRKLLGYEADEATQVAVFLGDHRDSNEVAAALAEATGGEAAALTWSSASPDLAGMVAMDRAGAIAMEIIVMLLLAAGIFNTLFASVMERMREFGIMAALGFSASALFALVMWESLWLGIAGLGLAAILCAYPYYYLATTGFDYSEVIGEGAEVAGVAMEPILYVDLHPENGVLIAIAALLATMLSGLYPAWRAGHTNPAEVIRLQ